MTDWPKEARETLRAALPRMTVDGKLSYPREADLDLVIHALAPHVQPRTGGCPKNEMG